MILTTTTKNIKSADLENSYDAILVDERIIDGFPQDKLVRVHESLGVISTLTFDEGNKPVYSIQDLT